jgi:N-acetylmuramoyl-L-alanine amidase
LPPIVASAPEPAAPRLSTHKVRRGETLSGIARAYGTTTQDLRDLNRLRSSRVKVGQLLKVPRRS